MYVGRLPSRAEAGVETPPPSPFPPGGGGEKKCPGGGGPGGLPQFVDRRHTLALVQEGKGVVVRGSRSGVLLLDESKKVKYSYCSER